MEVVRNFINVSGLAERNDLPKGFKGQIIQYSETETVFIPDNQPDMKSIFQVMINVEKKALRYIRTHDGYSIVLDGIKRLKIIYTQRDSSGKANLLDLELPYNTFIELPDMVPLENISIFVLDAYFSLLDHKRIYSHIVFLLYVSLPSQKINQIKNTGVSLSRSDRQQDEPEEKNHPEDSEIKINSLDVSNETQDEAPLDEQESEPDEEPVELVDIDSEYL